MIILISLIIIVCLLLVLVILAQNSKGGGLSSQFGGAGTTQLMGVKKTTDLLEKMTWGLAIALVVLTLATTFLTKDANQGGLVSPNIERASEQTVVPGIGGTELQPEAEGNEAQPATTNENDPNVDPSIDPKKDDGKTDLN